MDLARETFRCVNTIRRAGVAEHITTDNELAIRRALKFAVAEFIDENDSGAGVRIKNRITPQNHK